MLARIRDILAGRTHGEGPAPMAGRANAAVLIPLFEDRGRPGVLFIRRSHHISLHKGQMGFPGGMAEAADRGDLMNTALRETQEEVGVMTEDVEVVGELTLRSTIVSGLNVQPFVGIIPWPYILTPDPLEVAGVHNAFLEDLARDVMWGENRFDLPPPVYPVGGYPVWGLTAKILTELLELLKDAGI
ncbi:MAG: CoA pyrophosphatase [bacterium]|nr:MAG: CoA pyrophosphatase [bacterium]